MCGFNVVGWWHVLWRGECLLYIYTHTLYISILTPTSCRPSAKSSLTHCFSALKPHSPRCPRPASNAATCLMLCVRVGGVFRRDSGPVRRCSCTHMPAQPPTPLHFLLINRTPFSHIHTTPHLQKSLQCRLGVALLFPFRRVVGVFNLFLCVYVCVFV